MDKLKGACTTPKDDQVKDAIKANLKNKLEVYDDKIEETYDAAVGYLEQKMKKDKIDGDVNDKNENKEGFSDAIKEFLHKKLQVLDEKIETLSKSKKEPESKPEETSSNKFNIFK